MARSLGLTSFGPHFQILIFILMVFNILMWQSLYLEINLFEEQVCIYKDKHANEEVTGDILLPFI